MPNKPNACLMPTSDGAIHLPLYNKKAAYLEYCKDIQSQPSMIPCYSYFNQVWRTAVELDKIKTQRKVGTLQRCGVCRKYDMMVVGLKAEDHVKRAEITALRHGHTLLQRYERQFYTQKRLLGVIDPTNYLRQLHHRLIDAIRL